MFSNRPYDDPPLVRRIEPVEAEEHHSVVRSTLAKHQLPKVLVDRYDDSLLACGIR